MWQQRLLRKGGWLRLHNVWQGGLDEVHHEAQCADHHSTLVQCRGGEMRPRQVQRVPPASYSTATSREISSHPAETAAGMTVCNPRDLPKLAVLHRCAAHLERALGGPGERRPKVEKLQVPAAGQQLQQAIIGGRVRVHSRRQDRHQQRSGTHQQQPHQLIHLRPKPWAGTCRIYPSCGWRGRQLGHFATSSSPADVQVPGAAEHHLRGQQGAPSGRIMYNHVHWWFALCGR